jgi:ElaB/YqjD/DUF883 family membrane-anchored ribosome-binding protein
MLVSPSMRASTGIRIGIGTALTLAFIGCHDGGKAQAPVVRERPIVEVKVNRDRLEQRIDDLERRLARWKSTAEDTGKEIGSDLERALDDARAQLQDLEQSSEDERHRIRRRAEDTIDAIDRKLDDLES